MSAEKDSLGYARRIKEQKRIIIILTGFIVFLVIFMIVVNLQNNNYTQQAIDLSYECIDSLNECTDLLGFSINISLYCAEERNQTYQKLLDDYLLNVVKEMTLEAREV